MSTMNFGEIYICEVAIKGNPKAYVVYHLMQGSGAIAVRDILFAESSSDMRGDYILKRPRAMQACIRRSQNDKAYWADHPFERGSDFVSDEDLARRLRQNPIQMLDKVHGKANAEKRLHDEALRSAGAISWAIESPKIVDETASVS